MMRGSPIAGSRGPGPWVTGALVALGCVLAGAAGAPRGAVDAVHGALGGGGGDLGGVAWGLWRVAQHWPGPPPLEVPEVLVPEGARLLVADLPEAVLVAPMTWTLGPVAAANLLQVVHIGLAVALAAALATALGVSRWAAAAAGACLGLSPVLLSSVHNGNPDVTPVFWVPLAALVARRALDGPWRGLAAGLSVGLAAWFNPYCGVMAGVATLVFLGGSARLGEGVTTRTGEAMGPGRRRLRGALGLLAGIASAALVGGTYAALQARVLARPGSMVARSEPLSPAGSADLSGLLGAAWEVQFGAEGVHAWYLGVLAVGLALVGWRGGARAWGLVLAGLGLGLGPILRWSVADAGGVPGPWAAIGRWPGLSGLHLEYRFVALAALGVGLLAARGIDTLTGRLHKGRGPVAALLALGLATDLLLRGGGPALLRWGPSPLDVRGCQALDGLANGPVLDLPGTLDERWLLAQSCHERPVAAGLNRPWSGRVAHALAEPPEQAAGTLSSMGFRYVLIHEDVAPAGQTALRDAWASAARSGALPIETRTRDVIVVDLDSVPRAPPPTGGTEDGPTKHSAGARPSTVSVSSHR